MTEHQDFVQYVKRYYGKLENPDFPGLPITPYNLESQLSLLKQNGLKPNLQGAVFIACGLYLNSNKLIKPFHKQVLLATILSELYMTRHELENKDVFNLIKEAYDKQSSAPYKKDASLVLDLFERLIR